MNTIPSQPPEHCLHFGECGGCQSQDVAYPDQLAAKAALLSDLLKENWSKAVPVTASPQVWHYRNKVDPSFAPKRYDEPPPPGFVRETVLGFKRKGRWFLPMDIEECRIAPEGVGGLIAAVRGWYQRHALRAYDTKTHTGLLRTLLVREGKHTGERMVVLITTPGDLDAAEFCEVVDGVFPCASIQHGIFEGKAEVTAADELRVLRGAPEIHEELHLPEGDSERRLRFRISPFSFFQTNTRATELLYAHIRAWARSLKARRLYDLYGGAGGIAFSCSDLVEQVVSVEEVETATRDGRVNAAMNSIGNVTFVTAKVEAYLKQHLLEEPVLPDDTAVVVDPSRAGLHPKALRRLLELRPPHLLYVSCNPKILAQELPGFLDQYALSDARGFDLFPHTKHVELVVALRRK